jgi:subtilisin family serine protease
MGFKVLANKVWDTCKGSDNTIVAVIDTGMDLNHPDLKDHI